MKRKEIIAAVTGIALVAILAWGWLSPPGLTRAPDITLTTITGKKIDLKSLQGKPVLINFWATSCPGCVKEMPQLVDLHNELHAKGLTIIGVAVSYDPPNQVLEMVKERRIPYPIALDPMGDAERAFGNVSVIPTSFLIAPDGRIVQHVIGEIRFADLRARLSRWLKS